MPYSPKAIANKFLELAQQESQSLTQMQIQKLVYISHGFHLALVNQPLIDEEVQAWQYGPVIPSLYEEFRGFGNKPITKEATITTIDDNFNINSIAPRVNDTQTEELIKAVWNKYKVYSGPNLSDLTHQTGTPWSTVVQSNSFFSTIDNSIIRNYYNNLLAG